MRFVVTSRADPKQIPDLLQHQLRPRTVHYDHPGHQADLKLFIE